MFLFIWYLVKAVLIALLLWGGVVLLVRKLYRNFAFEPLHLVMCAVVAVLTVVLSVFISVVSKTQSAIQAGVEQVTHGIVENQKFMDRFAQMMAGVDENVSGSQGKDVVTFFESQIPAGNALAEYIDVKSTRDASSFGDLWKKVSRADAAERPRLMIGLLTNQYVAPVVRTMNRIYWGLVVTLVFFQGVLFLFLLGQAKKCERVNEAFRNFDF